METEKKRRGRPRKEKKVEEEEVEKKKRGRPAKGEREERSRVGMDIIGRLLWLVEEKKHEREGNNK